MNKKRHVDYVPEYSANLTPVIPHDATLSPRSSIDPTSRGKVPGQKKLDGTWVGGWKDLGDATLERARIWDGMGADKGFRTGRGESPTVNAFDVDLTVREDVERVHAIATDLFGRKLAVRRVDHPDHVKILICVRIEGPAPRSFDVEVLQSDGRRGTVQFLGPGRYFTVHGLHNRRLKPYIWDRDPADFPLTSISPVEFQAFWDLLAREFQTAPIMRPNGAHQVGLEPPERCTEEELEALLDVIPNDETFTTYRRFIAMGSAIHGASAGAPWGRTRWLAWCEQIDQGQPDKPELFWDTMLKSRIGADALRRWANERAPYEMAARAFADPAIEEVEPDLVEEANEDAKLAKSFLKDWCLISGADFYRLSDPRQPMSATAFGMTHAANEKAIKRALGGDKRISIAKVFARRSPNLLEGIVHEPGQSRIIMQNGRRFLNLWSPPLRPHRGLPIDHGIIDFYRDLTEFVLGSLETTDLWIKWHAWLLQNPDKAPGWQWLVQTGQGRGKDLILRPIGLAHGADYTPINPKDLSSPYNDYAEKHLISTSEMKARGDDAYTMLKAITSGASRISIRVQYRQRYLAANVASFIIFSNDEHPLKIDHDDRRLHVVSNFSAERRTPEYYARAAKLMDDNWAMIGEHLSTLSLSDADRHLLTGNAPSGDAKLEMVEQTAERALLDIIGEIESDKPPPGYLPVATTGDIVEWLEKEKLRPHEMPNRFELLSLLYRLGARPLNPNRKNPKRAEPINGSRLWRIAKTWTDQKGAAWDIEAATPARLAKLYSDRSMPSMTRADFTVIEDEDPV